MNRWLVIWQDLDRYRRIGCTDRATFDEHGFRQMAKVRTMKIRAELQRVDEDAGDKGPKKSRRFPGKVGMRIDEP